MKKLVLLVIFLLGFLTHIIASPQAPNIIIYKGKKHPLHSDPMHTFFEQNPNKRPDGYLSTGLIRGYIATFESDGKELFVTDIKIMGGGGFDDWKSVMNEVFPGQQKVKVDWMTGLLLVPYGKLEKHATIGFNAVYSNYIILEVNKGHITKKKNFKKIKYEIFKKQQFEKFKKTKEYQNFKEQNKKKYPENSDELIDQYLNNNIIDYLTKILD